MDEEYYQGFLKVYPVKKPVKESKDGKGSVHEWIEVDCAAPASIFTAGAADTL